MTTKIRTELPVSMETLRAVITTPNAAVEVDYANSKLKGRAALIYLTNTNLPNITLDVTGVEAVEKCQLVADYITQKSTLFIPQLVDTILYLLFKKKNVQLPFHIQSYLDQATLAGVTEDLLTEPLNHLIHVLDSLPLYAVSRNVGFQKTYGKPEAVFEIINNVDYTGFTFVNLFKHPLFVDYYTAPITTKPVYFVQQFEEYMFSGKSLFALFAETPIMAIMDCFTSGNVTVEQLAAAMKQSKLLTGATA